MRIEVIPFAAAIDNKTVENKTVIVIDVLRATSVMITALKNGAKEIFPALTIEDAWTMAKKFSKNDLLIGGERNAKKVEGFNLGNSPLEYSTEKVKRKIIILSTTNGTKALHACEKAYEVLIGAFLNVDAVVKKVLAKDELVLVCSGTNGKFSLDDGICAAMIINGLSKKIKVKTDDLGLTLLKTYQSEKGDLMNLLKDCFHLNYLLEKGYEKDVNYCLQANLLNIVPVFNDQKITIPVI